MKTFIKDYGDLCKHSLTFYKKHWKGVVVMNVVTSVVGFGILNRERIMDDFKSRKEKLGES